MGTTHGGWQTLRQPMTLARQLRQRSWDQRLGALLRFTSSSPFRLYASLPAGTGGMLGPAALLLHLFCSPADESGAKSAQHARASVGTGRMVLMSALCADPDTSMPAACLAARAHLTAGPWFIVISQHALHQQTRCHASVVMQTSCTIQSE